MIRFMFLRNKAGSPVGCIAVDGPIQQGNTYVLPYGLSVLNPLDKFDRALARNIAVGRLNNSTTQRTGQVYDIKQPNMHTISKAVMRDLLINPHAPSRARKAARLWLTNNATR